MADTSTKSHVFEVFDFGEGKGRGLRSLKALNPGDKVLECNPVVYVLSNSVRGQCCDFCFSRSEEIQRCSKCKFARYCNRECQKSGWKDHKIECERVLKVFPNIPTDLVRLMARITQQKNTGKSVSTARHRSSVYFDSLVSHPVEFDDKQKEAFASILTVLKQFVGEQHFELHPTSVYFDLFCKISCNSFTICDAELQPLGVGLYETASLLNHSCLPNCVAVFSGTELLIHVTEKIHQGDELTISYTELCCPSSKRKEDLKSRYFFECCCPKCMSPAEEDGLMQSLKCFNSSCQGALPKNSLGDGFAVCNNCGKTVGSSKMVAKAEALASKTEKALQEVKLLEKASEYKAINNLCEAILKEQQGTFYKLHYSKINILDKAMDACIFLELWDKALVFGLQTMEAYKLFYPRNHPSVGIQLFRIGKLQVYLDKLEDGFQSLLQAEAILQVTHVGLPIVQELRELISQTLAELREERNAMVSGVELI